MLMAELAVFLHFEPVGIVLLVFHAVIIPLLAIGTGQYNLNSHVEHLQPLVHLFQKTIFDIKKKTFANEQ